MGHKCVLKLYLKQKVLKNLSDSFYPLYRNHEQELEQY